MTSDIIIIIIISSLA